jgi:hypothetical protein
MPPDFGAAAAARRNGLGNVRGRTGAAARAILLMKHNAHIAPQVSDHGSDIETGSCILHDDRPGPVIPVR